MLWVFFAPQRGKVDKLHQKSRQFRPKSRAVRISPEIRHISVGWSSVSHPKFKSFALQRFILETNHMTMPITPRTSSTPTQTPALKISPITSQPLSVKAAKSRTTNKNHDCFINTLPDPDELTRSLTSEMDRSNLQNLIAPASRLVINIHIDASRIPAT
jgi:hypothetical protein